MDVVVFVQECHDGIWWKAIPKCRSL